MLKKILKMLALIIGGLILTIALIGVLFLNLSPQFGGKPNAAKMEVSPQYKGGKFVNIGEIDMTMTTTKIFRMLRGFFGPQPNSVPKEKLPVDRIDSLDIAQYTFDRPRLIWFGHSAFLLQINGKNILLDPMFGEVPAPHPLLGNNRFSDGLPIEIAQLPQIDAVILSHDHYDHLDYESIVKLKEKVKMFYAPLGVGSHLRAWNIKEDQIKELDWWDESMHEDLRLICTPAQHFSGRGVSDRAATLWASWIIQSDSTKLYFSGDSGYGDHFKTIGERFGPFDLAMMECGQYNELWKEIHMMPEETAQAAVDLQAKVMMPIHWGSFKLAMHSWTDPVERVTSQADQLGIPVTTPRIGEQMMLGDSSAYPTTQWWAANK